MAAALVVPALSLAGGSAGNQQYTDPFGSSSQSSTTQAAPPSTTASPAPGTTPASAPATTTAADPTATAATATTSSGTLPYTGYDVWTGVGFAVTLIAGGIVLRRRAHRA